MIVAHVFISYATPDRAVADEVAGWLLAAGHEPFLAHDRNGISIGEDWEQRLYDELRRARRLLWPRPGARRRWRPRALRGAG